MKAKQLFKRRVTLSADSFAELVAWEVPEPVPGSQHLFKYRLAFIHQGLCHIRYDNETGKGDHKHLGVDELPYQFTDVDQLVMDFLTDVRRWQHEYSNS